jgi:hypothetical protein
MPRDLVLGNGSLLVCMDSRLSIRDLYWPYVGLYNHVSGRAIRFGVWVDGQFAWIDDRWERDLRYRLDCLVTECRLLNERLHLELTVSDAVDGGRGMSGCSWPPTRSSARRTSATQPTSTRSRARSSITSGTRTCCSAARAVTEPVCRTLPAA